MLEFVVMTAGNVKECGCPTVIIIKCQGSVS